MKCFDIVILTDVRGELTNVNLKYLFFFLTAGRLVKKQNGMK